ncbi:MAG: hypothetical protein MJ144_05520 [Clostridia bacterium]|nr:hypothetical protein [Clostridia bacterium]
MKKKLLFILLIVTICITGFSVINYETAFAEETSGEVGTMAAVVLEIFSEG